MTTRQKILVALPIVVGLLSIAAVTGLTAVLSFTWVAATKAGNEAATIQNLRTIAAVEAQFFYENERTFATLDQLVQKQMLSAKFAAQPLIADGYVLTLTLKRSDSYTLNADPVDRSSGTRHFYLDSVSEQIRVNQDVPAGPNDPLFEHE